jgi:Domain of unknown function (DUF4111)
MSRRSSPADDAHGAARAVGRALTDALGEDLVAVYLHGSAVLGGFRWDRSDLDTLALSRVALSDQQIRRVTDALGPLAYPANGLEFSLMTAGEASEPEFPAPLFQLHMTTDGRAHVGAMVDGRARAGDSDLVLHLAVCRAHGFAIVGPPPRATLAAVPDEAISAAMRNEIGWARAHASPEYLVLTSARAWLFAETRRLASKVEAGEWAAERYSEPLVLEVAVARQHGTNAVMNGAAVERFVVHVERLSRRE